MRLSPTLVCLAACLPAVVQAATEQPIVITAARNEQLLAQAPVSIAVLNTEDLRRTEGGSIADFFSDIPGIDIVDLGIAGGGRLSIRGESGSRCLVLIDGQPIVENKSMDGAPLLIDPSSIARVEVVKGPASVLYGSESIGGVVNFITHTGASDKPFSGSIDTVWYSASEGAETRIRMFGQSGDWRYRVGGSWSEHGNRRAGGGTKINDTNYDQWSVNAHLAHHTDTHNFSLTAEHFHGQFAVTDYTDPEFSINLDLPEWSRSKINTQAQWKNITPLLSSVQASGYWQVTDKSFDNDMYIVPITTAIAIHTENRQPTLGAHVQADWIPTDNHTIITGIDLRRDDLEARSHKATTTFFGTDIDDSAVETHMTTAALYIQDEWMLTDTWTLTSGCRITTVEGGVDSSNDNQVPIQSGSDTHAVGSLAAVYAANECLNLRFSLAQGYNYPTMDKLYIGTSHGSDGHTFANPALVAEESYTTEIGLRFNNDLWSADISCFVSSAQNYLTSQLLDDGSINRIYVNADTAETRGVEMAVSKQFAQTWTPYINATVLQRAIEEDGVSNSDVGVALLSGRCGLRWGKEGTPLRIDGYLRGATDADEKSESEHIHTPAWITANCSVEYTWATNTTDWQLLTQFSNLLDHDYTPATQSVPATGRAVTLTLSMSW